MRNPLQKESVTESFLQRIQEGDRVDFVLEGGEARLRLRPSITQQTAGLFAVDRPPLSAEQLRDAAEQAFVDEVLEHSST